MKYYRLTDQPTREECDALNIERPRMVTWIPPTKDGRRLVAVRTSEFRKPRKGEWYLSGATPTAWRAPNDLSTKYRILRLAVVNRETRVIETLEV